MGGRGSPRLILPLLLFWTFMLDRTSDRPTVPLFYFSLFFRRRARVKALGTEFDSSSKNFLHFFRLFSSNVLYMANLLPEYWWEETEGGGTVVGKGVLWDQKGRGGRIKFTVHSRSPPSLPPHWRRRNVPLSVSLSLPPSPLFFLFSFHVEKRKEEVGGGRRRPPPQLQHTKHYKTTHRFPPPHTVVVQFLRDVNVCTLRGRRPSLSTDEVRSPPSFLPLEGEVPWECHPPLPPSSFSPVKPLFKRSVYTKRENLENIRFLLCRHANTI